ncbi:hypothetical protein O3P69_019613 [Scylla paramamosain]|uniref:Ig-like domain-containing protein n=1 Tax=Scylla paramamosain TaxID=85552 RepID=A0AAW0SWE0_SCYPA
MKKGIVLSMGDDVFTENPRISVHHRLTLDGAQAWVLTIKRVNLNDTGSYMCSLNTPWKMRKFYYLAVVVPPSIQDSNTSSDTEVQEGLEVRLRCGASGNPQPVYRWQREDSRMIDSYGKAVSGSQLIIPHALRHHAGAYLCIASNGVPPSVSKRILLSVKFQPVTHTPTPRLWVHVGDTITLSCIVDAYPRPSFVWVREHAHTAHATPTQRFPYHLHHAHAKRGSTLGEVNATRWVVNTTLRQVRPQDFGRHLCIANNSEGVAQTTVSLYPNSSIVTQQESVCREPWRGEGVGRCLVEEKRDRTESSGSELRLCVLKPDRCVASRPGTHTQDRPTDSSG